MSKYRVQIEVPNRIAAELLAAFLTKHWKPTPEILVIPLENDDED